MQHSSARVTEQDGSGEGRSISVPHKNKDTAPIPPAGGHHHKFFVWSS